jgi:hypothetical protein
MTSTKEPTTEAESYIERALIGVLPSLAGGEGIPVLAAPAGAAQLPATATVRIYNTIVFVHEQQSSLYHERASWDPM